MRALVKRSPTVGYEYDENATIDDPGDFTVIDNDRR